MNISIPEVIIEGKLFLSLLLVKNVELINSTRQMSSDSTFILGDLVLLGYVI